MGNLEAFHFHNIVAKKQDIDVDVSRALVLGALSAHVCLYGEGRAEKLDRSLAGIDGDSAVDEAWLRDDFHGFGLVEGRNGDDVPDSGQEIDCGMQVSCTVAEVRSE